MKPHTFRLAILALTLVVASTFESFAATERKVLLIDGGGSLRCALVGDQLAILEIGRAHV